MNAKRLTVLILMPAIWSSAQTLLAQSITLRSSATVDTDQVRLGQVADVRSQVEGEADAIANLSITTAPSVGGRMTVTLGQVRDRLAQAGVNRAAWTLSGSAQCRVTRVAGAARQIEEMSDQSRELREGLTGPIVSVPEDQIPDSLAGCIRSMLVTQFQPAGGRLTIEFDAADRSLLALRRPQFRFELAVKRSTDRYIDVIARIYAADSATSGQPESRVRQAAAEQLVKSSEIRVNVDLTAPVVVARRTINRGQIVAADDVQLVMRQVPLTSPALRKLEAAVGQEARRSIRADDLVNGDDLTPRALVHRNTLVTVWGRRGGVVIKTVGRAMEEGAYGQRILCRNEQSRQPFYAVVTGPDTVELDPTPVQETRGGGDKDDRQARNRELGKALRALASSRTTTESE